MSDDPRELARRAIEHAAKVGREGLAEVLRAHQERKTNQHPAILEALGHVPRDQEDER
jgi:hypothetical protein